MCGAVDMPEAGTMVVFKFHARGLMTLDAASQALAVRQTVVSVRLGWLSNIWCTGLQIVIDKRLRSAALSDRVWSVRYEDLENHRTVWISIRRRPFRSNRSRRPSGYKPHSPRTRPRSSTGVFPSLQCPEALPSTWPHSPRGVHSRQRSSARSSDLLQYLYP